MNRPRLGHEAGAAHLQVTIVPREKFPLGQTVVRVNEARESTRQFTRRYLEEQVITVLAGATPQTALRCPGDSCYGFFFPIPILSFQFLFSFFSPYIYMRYRDEWLAGCKGVCESLF